jgi:peptidyl-prolyl cis-trans isomerase B (cyclophilin B)
MRLLPVLCAVALLAGALQACNDDDDDDGVAQDASTELPEGCEAVEAPAPKEVSLPEPGRLEPPPPGTEAAVETSCGTFVIELDVRRAPKTTGSFAYLAHEGVYDGTAFHKVVPNFVIQGGDPAGDGTGGPGYFVDEPPPPDTAYTRGTVAMAKSPVEPPGRSGSQFFVVTAADAGLPPAYALLGRVTSGEEVVERIAELADPEGGSDRPRAPVVIERVVVRASGGPTPG